MPLYELISAKTGRTYQVEFANEPNEVDVDEALSSLDGELNEPAAPTDEQPGFGTQLYESVVGGGQLALGGGRTSLGVLTGDVPGMAAGLTQMQQAQARLQASQTPEDVAFAQDIAQQAQEMKDAEGVFPTLREAVDLPLAVVRRPGAALRTAVQSLPNVAITTPVTIAGGLAGAAVGAAAGLPTTGPGAVATGLAGGIATGAAANAAIEVGYALNDLLNERTGGASATMTEEQIAAYLEANPDIVDEAQRIGLTRGATIGAVEALGLKGAGRLTAAPARAAEQAARTALAREGVDLASRTAVREAMATPALREAAETAAKAATDQFNLPARALGAVGIEAGAAAGGELAAQAAAGQELDFGEAFLETLGEGLAAPATALAARRVDMPAGSVLNLPAQQAVQTAAVAMGDEFPSVEELTATAGPEAAAEVAAAVAQAGAVLPPTDLESGLADLGAAEGDVAVGLPTRTRAGAPEGVEAGLTDLGTVEGDLLQFVPQVQTTLETPTTPESLPAVEAQAEATGQQPATQTPDETEIPEAGGLPPVESQPLVQTPAVEAPEGAALGGGQGQEGQVTPEPVQPMEVAPAVSELPAPQAEVVSPEGVTDEQRFAAIRAMAPAARTAEDVAWANDYSRNLRRLEAERAAAEAAAKRAVVDEFLAPMTPMQRSKANAALEVNMERGNRVLPRRTIIEEAIQNGATVQRDAKGKRSLVSPSGAFVEESRLTKTAMDYAEFLLRRSQPLPPTGGVPTESLPAGQPTSGDVGADGESKYERVANSDAPKNLEVRREIVAIVRKKHKRTKDDEARLIEFGKSHPNYVRAVIDSERVSGLGDTDMMTGPSLDKGESSNDKKHSASDARVLRQIPRWNTQPTSGDVGTALRAVATNTATPEQVASLEAQGLARTVQGQPVITDAGLALMPEAERPRLTEAERVAEIEGQVAETADSTQEINDAIDSGLTDSEKSEAAQELGEPEWNEQARSKFKQALADWSLGIRSFSSRLVELFQKVLRSGKSAILSAAFFIGPVNVTTEGVASINRNPETISVAEIVQQVPSMQAQAGATAQVDFRNEYASEDVRTTANWILQTGDNQGKAFLVADKTNGQTYVFNGAGVFLQKTPALFGAGVGDVSPSAQARIQDLQRTTPSGRFEASLSEYPDYGGEIVSFYGAQDYQIAIHKLYLDEPAERRAQRLASDSPADNRISWGCINVAEDTFFDFIRFAFEEGGVVYVLPETEQGRSVFPPLGGRATTPQFNIPSSGIMPSLRPLQGDQQRNETLARRRRGKPTVPTGLRTIDGAPLAGITPTLSQATQARTLEAAQTPGAQDTWIGTSEEYLADNPDASFVADNPTLEAFYDPAVDRAVILTDRVQVREGDAVRAARNGTSAGLEAVRRLIRHESFVHRGWRALPKNLKDEFLSISENVVPADDLDQLAKIYKRFANWRNDPSIRALAVEEWLAQRLERIEKLPAGTDSVLNQLVDWAKRVWQWLAGDDSVEPTRAELVDLMRQMVRALETGEKDGVVVEAPTAEAPTDIRFSLTGNEAEIERIIREDRDDAESGVVPTRARPLAPGASPTSATEQLGPRTVRGKKIDGQEIIERNRIQETSLQRTKDRAIEIVDAIGPMDQWTSTLLNPAWQEQTGLNIRSPLGQYVIAEALNRVSNVSKKDRLRYGTLNDLLARQWQTGATESATTLAARSGITSDPRYAALFAVQAMIDEQRKRQAGIIDPALGSTEATVEATRNADTEAQQQATEDVDSELRLKDALYELGLAGQNPDTQQRIRRVNDNVFRLGVLARLREQMRARAEQASFVSLSASAVEAEYAAMSVEQLDAEVARLERELQEDLAALETERRKVRTTKPKGTTKTVVEQAKDLIAKLEAAPGVKKTPKPNPVRDLYKAHLKQPMAEGDFIKALTDMGVELEDAQKLYGLAAVKIAAAEAVAAQKQAEREAARQAREADKPTPAEAFAARTINEVANRLADPASSPAEKEQKVLPIRELYKEHVRDGLPLDVFVQRSVTAGLDEQTAFILHGVGTMERDAAETRRGYNEAGAAQRFAERVVDEAAARFADPALPQPVRNKRKNAIRELYAAHVKTPMGRDAFVEAARKLGVDERTAATMHGVGTMESEARAIQKDARNVAAEARRLNDRTARLLDTDKNSLENLINKLRPKITGGLNWREIFDRPLTNQREWRQQLFDTLRADPALANLSPAEVRDLAAEIDRIWNDKREAAFKALAKRMNLPGAREGVKEKIAESAPALIRYINSGAFNDVNFRNAIADKFGVPQLDEARVDEVIALVQKAQEAETQVERNKYMVQAIRLMQEGMKAELGEVISNYWVTSVLSGFATLFDMALSVLNGARVMTQFSADAIIRQRDFKLAGRAAKNYFQSLGNAILESTYYFVSGDPSMLDNYQFTLNTYLREGSAAANPFDYFERIIKDPSKPSWAKIVPYYFAGLQRLMTAFDHINSTSTAQGTLEHALAYNRKLFGDARMPSQQDVAAARAKAVQLAGGDRTFAQKRKVTAYTRQILNEEFNKTYPGILDEAKDIGRIAAYQNDPTGIGGLIYHTLLGLTNKAVKAAGDFRDEGRALGEAQGIVSKFMREFMYILAVNSRNISGTRFVRFVGNRVNELISFTPGAGFLRLYEKDTSPTRRAMLLQNQTVGILLGTWVVATLLRMMDDEEDDEKRGFRVSGSWQGLTPDRKNQLRANNMTPNSVQIWDGEKWVNFNYTPWPVASLLATVGNLADMKKYHPERWGAKEPLDRILAAAWAGAFSFKDLSAISGFMDMFGASAYSGDPVDSAVKWLGKFSSNYVGGVVPRMLKDIDMIMDPKARKPTDIMGHFIKEVPFYRRTEAGGERMYNIFGEPVELNRLPWRRVVTASRPEREYQILAELNNRGLFLGVANADNRTVGYGASRRELTDEEAERYAVETGKRYRQFILDQGERLLEMPEERAKEFISRRTEALRNAALRDAIRTQL